MPTPTRSSLRFDASYPREFLDAGGQVQTRWYAMGTGFLGEVGISVVLHAVPTATHEGQTRFSLFPARGSEEEAVLPEGLPARFVVASYRTYAVEGGERTAKTIVGVAFTREDHIAVLLNAVPTARVEGAIRLFLRDAAAGVNRDAEGEREGDAEAIDAAA